MYNLELSDMLSIYLVSRRDAVDYDEYDSFVCVAETAHEALQLQPGRTQDTWTTPDKLECEYLGVAASTYKKPQVLLASFNAG